MVTKKFGFKFQPDSEKSQAIVERDVNSLSPSYTRSYGLVASHGKGAELWDVEGRRYLDIAAGIAVLSTGFSHPRIVDAIKQQSERMIHIGGTDFFYEEQVTIAEKLQRIIPIHHADKPEDKRVYMCNSGTEAIEAALKLARYRGGDNGKRRYVIAFYGAFHGRTYGSLSVTASKAIQRADYPFLPGGVIHVPYPGKFAQEHSSHPDSIDFHPAKFIEKHVFKTVDPDEIAAIICEPIQGEGGYIVPTDSFLSEVRELCDEHGMLLIFDEIQSGMGRTGKWLASEHWGVKADIVCLAKGLGSGVPVGAIVSHADVMKRWVPGAHASTFGGNLLACKVAETTIDVIEDENLLDNAARVGAFAMERLHRLQAAHPDIIHRVEGKGLMIGVEFATEKGKPLAKLRDELVDQCFLNGLVALGSGKSTLRIAPALVITEEQMKEALDIIEKSLVQIRETQPAG